jgi:uncharacterized membrane protein
MIPRLITLARRMTRRRVGVPIEQMPGHPERVRRLTDPAADAAYWDIAEQLLDDGMADVVERLRWCR